MGKEGEERSPQQGLGLQKGTVRWENESAEAPPGTRAGAGRAGASEAGSVWGQRSTSLTGCFGQLGIGVGAPLVVLAVIPPVPSDAHFSILGRVAKSQDVYTRTS